MVIYQNQLFDFLRDPSLYISKELPIIRPHSTLSSSFSSFTFFSFSPPPKKFLFRSPHPPFFGLPTGEISQQFFFHPPTKPIFQKKNLKN
jgi:hypothetical protein